MRTRQLTTDDRQRDEHRHALRRGLGFWELTFEGRQAIFKHEQGALYIACLLLDPPSEPIHAVTLALKAREMGGQAPGQAEVIQERSMHRAGGCGGGPGGRDGYPALVRPSGRGRGRSGRAASGLGGLCLASARVPADALGPG